MANEDHAHKTRAFMVRAFVTRLREPRQTNPYHQAILTYVRFDCAQKGLDWGEKQDDVTSPGYLRKVCENYLVSLDTDMTSLFIAEHIMPLYIEHDCQRSSVAPLSVGQTVECAKQLQTRFERFAQAGVITAKMHKPLQQLFALYIRFVELKSDDDQMRYDQICEMARLILEFNRALDQCRNLHVLLRAYKPADNVDIPADKVETKVADLSAPFFDQLGWMASCTELCRNQLGDRLIGPAHDLLTNLNANATAFQEAASVAKIAPEKFLRQTQAFGKAASAFEDFLQATRLLLVH